MELIKFENTFATLEEAEDYISSHYISSDTYKKKWDTLSDDDKRALLINSTDALNMLKYVGRNKSVGQSLQFPRCMSAIGFGGRYPALYVTQTFDNGLISSTGPSGDPDGSKAITKACIENALACASLNEIVYKARENGLAGIAAMKAGNVSKTYNNNNRSTLDAQTGIYTNKIYNILAQWIVSSSFSI